MTLAKRLDELASEQQLRTGMRPDDIALTTERQNLAIVLRLQSEIVNILSEIDGRYAERLNSVARIED